MAQKASLKAMMMCSGCIWVYDDESAAWFQRRFQGRRMTRNKGKGKGKRKGKGRGRGGRRFFKRRKGKGHFAEDQGEAWQSEWWQDGSWDDDYQWSWEAHDESYAFKGKGKKGKKGKGKGKWNKEGGKDHSKGDSANTAIASSEASETRTQSFYTSFFCMSDLRPHEDVCKDYHSYMSVHETDAAYLAHELSPTMMVLDLGCTRAMTSRSAADALMKFCDQNPHEGLWYRLEGTSSMFTFANSESTECKQRMVVRMYDKDYSIQSTSFDIVEQGSVPILMSLPQMRNLKFKIELEPDKALLSSPPLGIRNMKLKVARSSHLVLDLLDVCRNMWNVKFEQHKKVSFFTSHFHYEFGYNLGEVGGSVLTEEPTEEALAADDEWVLDEAKMELVRVHKRKRRQSFVPVKGATPVPLEYLDPSRRTIFEFSDDKKETKNDNWKDDIGKSPPRTAEFWKGKTIFKILPGGVENRTSVPTKSAASGRKSRGSPDDIMSSKKEKPAGSSPLREEPAPVEKPGGFPPRKVPEPELGPEDICPPSPVYEPSEAQEELAPSGEAPDASRELPQSSAAPGSSSLEPRRISLPLPGQEVSRSSPQYRRMLEKLNNDVELYKLHVKHYHMSSAQFRRRTSMLGLPGEIYDKYDRIVKSCRICSTSVPSPPRARIAGLRASSFGDLVFVDHEEIKYGMHSYLALVILDGATNLLWATALSGLDATETLGAFRQWSEENNCVPKGIVGDQAFFTDPYMDYYRFHGITPYPCGPRTPWPNRAETAVRLFKRSWAIMAKALVDEGYGERVTVRQAVKKVVWARNCQLTISGYSPLEIATGRRPPDLLDVENSTPEQLSADPSEEDRTTLELKRIALRAHQEARQSLDLRKDLARRVMPSDGPYSKGDRVFVWMKDESKKKTEGIWVRGKVVSQEGAMVLVEVHQAVLRVNQSKVRRDHDPWHDVHIPLRPEPEGSPLGEVSGDGEKESEGSLLKEESEFSHCCYEHEICYHSFTSEKCDFLEVSHSLTGVSAYVARHDLSIGSPVLFNDWNSKTVKASIVEAWNCLVKNDPSHVFIHPLVPKGLTKRSNKLLRQFFADIIRWQDDRGCAVTVLDPWHDQSFCSSQQGRSVKWRYGFHLEEQWNLECSLFTNLPSGSFVRLESLKSLHQHDLGLDPRLSVLLAECMIGDCSSDHRQHCMFDDILDDFDDGTLCSLCMRSDRSGESLPVIPSKEEYSFKQDVTQGRLPRALHFVAPMRFVSASLVQSLTEVDRLLVGTELEIHTTTSREAVFLRPLLKNVRVLTLPHLEFEFCNVYRGTFGKTLPLLHRHPDAVVILWNQHDHDHVFFLTLSQLIPCMGDMSASRWSLIVFWNEGEAVAKNKGPDVGLDYTDQPVPVPDIPMPPQPGHDAPDEGNYPGYEDPHTGEMPVDDEDMPNMPPGNPSQEPDLDDDPIQYDTSGHPPPPPGGGSSGIEPVSVPNLEDEMPTPMEMHNEAPPPGGPPDAPGAAPQFSNPDQVLVPPIALQPPPAPIAPIPKHPHFPVPKVLRPSSPRNVSTTRAIGRHPEDIAKAKVRMQPPLAPVVPLPGQSVKKDSKDSGEPVPDEDGAHDPSASSSQPSGVPGLPVTDGEFPIIQSQPAPKAAPSEPPIPEADSDADSDATVDYRDPSSLLALVEGDEDVLIQLPESFAVPSFVPLDGDGFASWLTKQDKVKAGTVTQEMQRRYAKEIRRAKLEEFKSYMDNDTIRLMDRRKLGKETNFLTGRWVLTVKVDKDGHFSKFKARWVCRGFQDKFAWDQQTDSPTATRYGFRLVSQCAANRYWDLFHLDLKTAFLQGEHYNLESRQVVVQLPSDIGLPPWLVGLCLRPVYGLNDAPRRWWNRLDKFLRSVGLEPTRADRCTYAAYEGITKQKTKHKAWLAKEGSLLGEVSSGSSPKEGSVLTEVSSGDYYKTVAIQAMACYAYDEEMRGSSDTAEERSYMENEDIKQCFNVKHMVDYAWRPVTDSKLLSFLGGVAHKKRGWFPFENGHALVSHRAKALRGSEPTYKSKDYPWRISIVLRKGTWWIVEKARDMRNGGDKPCHLEEEAEVLVTLFLPEKASYQVESLSELSPELVDQLLEHFVDPVRGSPAKGRKTVGVMSLHVDDLIITGSPEFLTWFLEKIKKQFTVGHEDKNDLTFTGQRVRWVFDSNNQKKYISIDQKLCVSELEEIVVPKHLKDTDLCDKALHTSYRSLLGSINWLQSRTQFQACYQFSRLASASAAPTVGHCKELNKLCRQIRSEEVELRIWPVKGSPRILGIPDAAFRNNTDKSSQRAMTIFIADERVRKRRDTRGSLIFFESTKIKRTTLSTTVAELYALMKCFGTCQMLRGLWKDISGLDAEIHIRTDANNLVSTASTTHSPEQQETIHMIQMLRKEACSGAIADLSHVRTEHCLADCLTKRSANPKNLLTSVQTGWLKEIDSHPPFRELLDHKAFLNAWLIKELVGFSYVVSPTFLLEQL